MNIEGEDTKGKERNQRFGYASTRCGSGVKNMVERNEWMVSSGILICAW